jgi:uncharacterized protein
MSATLVNQRTGQPVAASVEIAATRRARRRGLLGRDSLDGSKALVLTPCAAVHTAFMRFDLDLAFIDRDGAVVKIVKNVPPWRIALAIRAHAVVELAAGTLQRTDVMVGDRLYVAPHDSTRMTLHQRKPDPGRPVSRSHERENPRQDRGVSAPEPLDDQQLAEDDDRALHLIPRRWRKRRSAVA